MMKRLLLLFATALGMAVAQDNTSVSAPTKLAADPGTCVTGQWYFNTTTPVFRGCTVTNTWTNLGSATPGGSSGQLQVNSGGLFAGITAGGDLTFTSPNFTVTKTGGVAFGAMATLTATASGGDVTGTWPTITVVKVSGVAFASANTASAPVIRDASGNFSAGTITAALTGTATGFSGQLAAANLTVLTTTQDILYRNGASLARLPIVPDGSCLGANAGVWTNLTCSGGGAGGGGVNSQTGNYTAVSGDAGKLIVMNCTSCTLTLPASPPSATWYLTGILNLNSTSLTISRNGLNINGVAANIPVPQFQTVPIWTDNTNYFAGPPTTNGFGASLTTSSTAISLSVNTAVIPSIAIAQAGKLNYCADATGTTTYLCSLSASAALTAYTTGMIILFNPSVTCTSACSVNIDSLGGKSIKLKNGTSDPGGVLIALQPQWLWYDGTVFRLMYN